MLSCFWNVVNVPYLTNIQHLVAVLKETDPFFESQIDQLVKKIGSRRISIPIEELMSLIDLAAATDEYFRVENFIQHLESAGFIYYSRVYDS